MLSNEVLNHKFHLLGEKTIDTATTTELIAAFKTTVETRDKMGGAMYYGMLNEECHMLYDVCRYKGVAEEIMQELFKNLK